MPETWTLHGDAGPLADLIVTDRDFPWLYAKVVAHPPLAPLFPLFAEELRLLEADDVPAWEEAYAAIRAAVTLRDPSGADVPEFLLHLSGDEAWWRWSDEPFDD